MPISPQDINKLKENDNKGLNKAYAIIDQNLAKRFNGQAVFISTEVLPSLSRTQQEELIKAYKKVGWNSVYFSSDRDGNYLYIGK